MTPVLVLWCQRMLSSLYFLPPSGAFRNAMVLIIWISSVTAHSYGAEGGRGALSGLSGVLNKASIPSFSHSNSHIIQFKSTWFCFLLNQKSSFPSVIRQLAAKAVSYLASEAPALLLCSSLSGGSEIAQFLKMLQSCFGSDPFSLEKAYCWCPSVARQRSASFPPSFVGAMSCSAHCWPWGWFWTAVWGLWVEFHPWLAPFVSWWMGLACL